MAPEGFGVLREAIRGIPVFDADLEEDQGPPARVVELRARIAGADGLLLATPEYNASIPGGLKNAVDWLSRPPSQIEDVFGGLPVGLMGATPGRPGEGGEGGARMSPRIEGLLETLLVVDDSASVSPFYEEDLGLEPRGAPDERGRVFLLPDGRVLGLVARAAARRANATAGGVIPPCVPGNSRSAGPGAHLALTVSELEPWKARLAQRGMDVLQIVEWEAGGRSLYVRDPAGHLVELAVRPVWRNARALSRRRDRAGEGTASPR